MSMIYCHTHDRHVDTDFHEDCPECLVEIEDAHWHETVTAEILHPSTPVETSFGLTRESWQLCCKFIGDPEVRIMANETDGWRCVYGSSDMLKIMEDAIEFNRTAKWYRYAIKAPEVKS